MLLAGQLVLPAEPGSVRLAEGWLRIDGGSIVEVGLGSGTVPGTPDLGDAETIISPGFADTHLHIPQFDSIGADGLPLLKWLDQVIFPAEARWEDADFAGQMAARVANRLLAAGTTAIAAYGTVHRDGSAAAMRALAEAGLSGHFGQVLMDRTETCPADLCRPTRQLVREAADWQPVGRLAPAVTPRFAVSCTAELLSAAGEIASQTGWLVQSHLSETVEECDLVRRMYAGTGYAEVYQRAGLVTRRSVFGHGIWLDDSERALLAAAGATVAHCPTANLFLQAGRMDLGGNLRQGVRVGLGSDVAGGPDVSMLRVARAAIETVKHLRLNGLTDRRLPTAAAAWWQITRGNAEILGLAGHQLLRGAPADLVLIRPSDDAWRRSADPLGTVLYAFDDRWMSATIVQGRLHSPRL